MGLNLTQTQYYEFLNLIQGVLLPAHSFMNEKEVESVCAEMYLPSNEFFPIPIMLLVDEDQLNSFKGKDQIDLFYKEKKLGRLNLTQVFKPNKEVIAQSVFKTTNLEHPGVKHLKNSGNYALAGSVIANDSDSLLCNESIECKDKTKYKDSTNSKGSTDYLLTHELSGYLTPAQTKKLFLEKGWKTIAGFQTRNIPHRAHEYLHRVSLEMVDGLMIQPLVGWKKTGDYTPEAIEKAYQMMISDFYPKNRVILNFLMTAMRYAGPKEALLHAIIRRNFGCTHFIVGRDHAGVQNFYGTYEAQNLALEYQDKIGIHIIAIREPFYCKKCDMIVTEKHCSHSADESNREDVSGTKIRAILEKNNEVDHRFLRPEILSALNETKLFID